jgi:hypothetical protein
MPADPAPVLLVGDRGPDLVSFARRLRALGFEVFYAKDLDDAETLVRSRLSKQMVFVHLTDEQMSLAELTLEIAARLPDWSVEAQDPVDDEIEGSSRVLARGSN